MDWPTQENFARWDADVSNDQIEADLADTVAEIERLRWLQENLHRVRAAFVDLGFTTSLATLQLLNLEVSIGQRIRFCDCLKELQRLRAERAKATERTDEDAEYDMDTLGSDRPSAAEADEMLGRQHYTEPLELSMTGPAMPKLSSKTVVDEATLKLGSKMREIQIERTTTWQEEY